jgi:signal peptidase I
MNEKELLESVNEEPKKKSWIAELVEYVVWLGAVWLVVQLIITFVGVFSIVVGDSMQPTLYDKEYLWVDKFSYLVSEPERFDVVIFPIEYRGVDSHFVKRIIGLPGETVYIDENGVIFIDDKVLPDTYGKEIISEFNRHLAAEPITLGPDEYFVLGDNRNHSSDSRLDSVGNISRDRLMGRVVARLWPINKIGIVK